jgi:hypothetical protein
MSEMRDLVYEQSRHSRENELAADSLGAIYLTRAGFYPPATASSLARLRDYDPYVLSDTILRTVLQTQSYPLKKKWITAPPVMFGGSFGGTQEGSEQEAFWRKDSLATHPDLELRVLTAEGRLPDLSPGTAEPAAHPLVEASRRAIVERFLDRGLGAHALIWSLAGLERVDDDPYYLAAVGRSLLYTYRAIQAHEFDRRIPPTNYFDDKYAAETLRLLHQVRNSELRRLTLAYLDERVAEYPEATELAAAREEAISYFKSLD